MPKKPISVTLEDTNLLWLRGRVATGKRRSLSDALDEVVTNARRNGRLSGETISVVGTADIANDDPYLERADEYVRAELASSLSRPFMVKEDNVTSGRKPGRRTPARKSRG